MRIAALPGALRLALARWMSAADSGRLERVAPRSLVVTTLRAAIRASYERAPPTDHTIRAALGAHGRHRSLQVVIGEWLRRAGVRWRAAAVGGIGAATVLRLHAQRRRGETVMLRCGALRSSPKENGGVDACRSVCVQAHDSRTGAVLSVAVWGGALALLRRIYRVHPERDVRESLTWLETEERQAELLAACVLLLGDDRVVVRLGLFPDNWVDSFGESTVAPDLAVFGALRAVVGAAVRIELTALYHTDAAAWRSRVPAHLDVVLRPWCCARGAAPVVLHPWCCARGAAPVVLRP
jgi:hypothetical protein